MISINKLSPTRTIDVKQIFMKMLKHFPNNVRTYLTIILTSMCVNVKEMQTNILILICFMLEIIIYVFNPFGLF